MRVQKAVDYVLSVLLPEDGGGESPRRAVAYGPYPQRTPGEAAVHIVASRFFEAGVYGTPSSLPVTPLLEIDGVPLLFGMPGVEGKDGSLIVHADIIASAYFLLTRYEEVVRPDVRDEHGRFPGKESLPYRAGFLHRPVVDEYAALLRKWLRAVGIDIPEPRRSFSVLLTHDVDWLRKYYRRLHALRTAASAFLGRQPLRNVREAFAVAIGLRRDPYDTFQEMIEQDLCWKSNGSAEAVYFFMAGGKSWADGKYDIRHRWAREAIAKAVGSGATIGLHTSYEASLHPELIAAEKAKLEQACGFPIRHNRHHYLAWREIGDGWALARAGIQWDSSLGYADVAGFRLGVCRPVPLFDPIRMEPLGIEEHPLVIMEHTLSAPKYMGLDREAAWGHCSQLIAETRKHDGELVVLWHHTAFAGEQGSSHRDLYQRLLDRVTSGIVKER